MLFFCKQEGVGYPTILQLFLQNRRGVPPLQKISAILYSTGSLNKISGFSVVLEHLEHLSLCVFLLLRSQDPGEYCLSKLLISLKLNVRKRRQSSKIAFFHAPLKILSTSWFQSSFFLQFELLIIHRHKSLVGNLVHLLWAPGQVDN